jgi:hypothetical protein
MTVESAKQVGSVIQLRVKKSDGSWHRTTYRVGDEAKALADLNAGLQKLGETTVPALPATKG